MHPRLHCMLTASQDHALHGADVECLQAWLWLQGNSDAVPAAPDGANVLQAMRTGGTPVKTTLVGALVTAAMQRHAPHRLTAHKGATSVSTSWMHQFLDQKLNR
eukprot:151972-Chlamydomonas_euryale.AAC.1